jgi:cytochrome c oxidase subunit 4
MKASGSRALVLTWLALLALLALTTASAFVPLHGFNVVVNLGIAFAKAALVVVVFMHLPRGTPMIRIFALAGVLWLCLLVALSLTDFAARG